MSLKNIRLVNSKEHELSAKDIFIVAAHEQSYLYDKLKPAAKKAGVTPERLLYTIMIKLYSDPRLIRLRNGNTFFTIAALKNRVGYVSVYNGDSAPNLINNMYEFFNSARKLGFDVLIAKTDNNDMVRILKAAVKRNQKNHPEVKFKFNPEKGTFMIKTGEPRK
jgi:hypothetical protein